MKLPFNGTFRLTQAYNDACCRASYAKFGLKGHNGQDYGLPTGTPVLAPHAGKILEATFDAGGYGNYLKVESATEGSVLAHLQSFKVSVGQTVTEGQLIGYSNNTGNSTGPHLHWGYYRIPRDRTNGFAGFIDQAPYLTTTPPPTTDYKALYEAEKAKSQALYNDKIALININKEVKPILQGVINKLKTE